MIYALNLAVCANDSPNHAYAYVGPFDIACIPTFYKGIVAIPFSINGLLRCRNYSLLCVCVWQSERTAPMLCESVTLHWWFQHLPIHHTVRFLHLHCMFRLISARCSSADLINLDLCSILLIFRIQIAHQNQSNLIFQIKKTFYGKKKSENRFMELCSIQKCSKMWTGII